MHYEATGIAIRTIVAIAAIVALVQFMILPTLVAEFRQRMFRIRRRMFLLVANGQVHPQEPAYLYLRNSINGLIRSAERITFTRFIFFGALLRRPGRQRRQRWDAAIMQVPDEYAREELVEFKRDMERDLIAHVVITSPIAWVLLVLLALAAIIKVACGGIVDAQDGAKKRIRKFIVQQLRSRLPTEAAEAEAEAISERAPTGLMRGRDPWPSQA